VRRGACPGFFLVGFGHGGTRLSEKIKKRPGLRGLMPS
jgi:hypothetical protein